MLSRLFRFRGHASLNFVYKRGQMVRGPLLSLKYVRNPRRKQYRAAVVVSRKVDKSAVVRNRIRRRIYEVIRLQADSIVEPYDLVFTAYSAQLADLPAAELQRQVVGQMRKAGVITSMKQPKHGIVQRKDV